MIVDPKQFIQYAIRKQNKISHVPCETLVFRKDEIPEKILKKIKDQYDENMLADCDLVAFTKGPIDKDMIKKIFKATDKALGEEANKMTEGDFKLLKMKDSDEDLPIEDPGDETPDSEIEAIVSDDSTDDAADDTEAEDPTDAANEEAIGDMLDSDGEEEVDESEKVNEAGMSLDDILKKGNDIAAKRNAEVDAAKAKKLEQKIQQIWIKDIVIDAQNEKNSVAKLQITYTDGKVEDVDFPIGTTGSDDAFKGDKEFNDYAVAGERYRQGDTSYKQTLQNLKRAFAKYHLEPTDEDVRIAQVRLAFNDYRIKWLYGKDKKDDPMFAFSRTQAAASANPTTAKALSKVAALRNKDRVGDSTSKGRVVYQNGGTTIYKANEAEEENNSMYARMHQGKSMAQWEKEFKGEFDVDQLWRMAASGCDLQKLLLNVNGHITFEDSEKQVNEAKEEDKKESKKEDNSEENDSEKETEETKEGKNPSGVAEEKPNVPTKWVFLKITLKK